jgi:hypothetical protein
MTWQKKEYSIFDDCVAFYDFKKDAKDVIGDNNGSVSGATLTTNHLGQTDSAYDFDGTDDKIDCGSDSSLNITGDITLCAWIKTTQSPAGGAILVGKDGGTATEMQYRILLNSSGTVQTNRGTHINMANSTIVANDGNWHFIVGTASSTTSTIYVDGVADGTGTTGSQKTANNCAIGWRDYNITHYDGLICCVGIWDKALSADEVLQLYNLTKNKVVYPVVRGGRK